MVAAIQTPNQTPSVPAEAFVLRPAEERGHADHGWLDSRHTFSFANYHDPRWMGFSNLRVINDDRVAGGGGFPMHPHQDAEIFSYVLDGALSHQDSMGHGSTVSAGGVQYMAAGTGVTHSEFNASQERPVRFLQVWLIPEVRGAEPRYDTLDIPREAMRGRPTLFLSPDGEAGSLRTNADARVYAAALRGAERFGFAIPEGRVGWVQVASGQAEVGGHTLREGDGLAVTQSGHLEFSRGVEVDGREAELLIFDLPGM